MLALTPFQTLSLYSFLKLVQTTARSAVSSPLTLLTLLMSSRALIYKWRKVPTEPGHEDETLEEEIPPSVDLRKPLGMSRFTLFDYFPKGSPLPAGTS